MFIIGESIGNNFLSPFTFHSFTFSPCAQAALTDPGRSAMLSGADDTLAQLLCQAKEENRMLRQEATELRCRLHDAQADTKVRLEGWRGGKKEDGEVTGRKKKRDGGMKSSKNGMKGEG